MPKYEIPEDERWPVLLNCLQDVVPDLGPIEEIDPDANLRDAGLDSLGSVSILVEIEDEFHITIPDEMLTLEMFESPRTIWQTLVEASNRQARQ